MEGPTPLTYSTAALHCYYCFVLWWKHSIWETSGYLNVLFEAIHHYYLTYGRKQTNQLWHSLFLGGVKNPQMFLNITTQLQNNIQLAWPHWITMSQVKSEQQQNNWLKKPNRLSTTVKQGCVTVSHQQRCFAVPVRAEWTGSSPGWSPSPPPWTRRFRVEPPPWRTDSVTRDHYNQMQHLVGAPPKSTKLPQSHSAHWLHFNNNPTRLCASSIWSQLRFSHHNTPIIWCLQRAASFNCTSFPADPNFPRVVRSDRPLTWSCWTYFRSFSPVFSPEPWPRGASCGSGLLWIDPGRNPRARDRTLCAERLTAVQREHFLTWAGTSFLHSARSRRFSRSPGQFPKMGSEDRLGVAE